MLMFHTETHILSRTSVGFYVSGEQEEKLNQYCAFVFFLNNTLLLGLLYRPLDMMPEGEKQL